MAWQTRNKSHPKARASAWACAHARTLLRIPYRNPFACNTATTCVTDRETCKVRSGYDAAREWKLLASLRAAHTSDLEALTQLISFEAWISSEGRMKPFQRISLSRHAPGCLVSGNPRECDHLNISTIIYSFLERDYGNSDHGALLSLAKSALLFD